MTKIQVRRGLFETNSSSVHSLTMCTETEYEQWKNGEMVYDYPNEELIPITDEDYVKWTKLTDEEKENKWVTNDYLTFDQFFDFCIIEFETFVQTYETPKGEKIVAFGYHGHD